MIKFNLQLQETVIPYIRVAIILKFSFSLTYNVFQDYNCVIAKCNIVNSFPLTIYSYIHIF